MSTGLARWDPFTEFHQIRNSMDRVFERGFGARPRAVDGQVRPYVPGIDVEEREDAFVVTAAIPGMRPEDVEITAEDGILTIKGATSREASSEDGKFLRRELHYGAFERALRLPDVVDLERADASIAGGMLTVSLPRREETRARVIKVQVGDAPAAEPGDAAS